MNLDTYLVTDAEFSAGRSTVDIVAAAIEGGIDVVQLREKGTTARSRYELGLELRELTNEAGIPLIVNDRVDIAMGIDADGVHLGDNDLPVETARKQLGDDSIIGRSVSTVADARVAEQAGADYLGVGAIFNTSSKDIDPEEAEIGPDRVAAIDDAVDIPFVGIGGVTPENAGEVVAAGADGVAVITAITQANDPTAATQTLNETVDVAKKSR